jgi:hypothetical protein
VADLTEAHAPTLQVVSPEGPLYRIARPPDPWMFPDWAHAGRDGTFGNRWDDANGVYRVLYASNSRLGALVEVLARFRPDPHVVAALRGWKSLPNLQAPPYASSVQQQLRQPSEDHLQ